MMPDIVSANPNATAVAIAERAAEQILTCTETASTGADAPLG
jgi:choline dehydrogenase-like flavoprotein